MVEKEIISRIVEKIKIQYKPKKIILFGSYAWGNPTKDSDLDLLIVKETNEKHRERSLSIRKILSEENRLIKLSYTPSACGGESLQFPLPGERGRVRG